MSDARPGRRGLKQLCALAVSAMLVSCGGGGGSSSSETSGGDTGAVLPPVATPSLDSYVVVAWNDLGMHCVDGKDYSVFSILPPYNNLHAQVLLRNAGNNKVVSSGITLTYEAVADATGSANTSSYQKTNFWTWVQKLFGAAPANDVGLTGNPTPSAQPAVMVFNAASKWWEATGIPVTPYDDSGAKNYYPMVKVVARDQSGNLLASSSVVLPVSDEMSCKTCHSSSSGYTAARPAAGWVNDIGDVEKDWKKNILRLHDDKNPQAIATAGLSANYTGGTLFATAVGGQPVLCAACHKSNALGTAQVGSIPPLTTAMHGRHAGVVNPSTSTSLEADATRTACYLCHPGSVTKCLRGAMGDAIDASGKPLIDCQSCHGPMSSVGRPDREGWLDEPACQNCHDRPASGAAFGRFTSVFSSGTTVRATVDRLFATNPDNPAAGKSLYRFSSGHGGLQCEACHGSTHAEYPSSHANDNVQMLALQGHTGTLAECTVCHATSPANSINGGPHGMHITGAAWVKQHRSVGWSAACAVCHGGDARGTVLSKVFATGQVIGCYDCHNGPQGGD